MPERFSPTPDRRMQPESEGLPLRPSGRPGFTILELEVSLAVLVAGLFCMVSLLSAQGRQMTRSEAWCRPEPTYYVVSHSNPWLRKLEASAELKSQAGQEPWSPPVSGPQKYDLRIRSWVKDFDRQRGRLIVEMKQIQE